MGHHGISWDPRESKKCCRIVGSQNFKIIHRSSSAKFSQQKEDSIGFGIWKMTCIPLYSYFAFRPCFRIQLKSHLRRGAVRSFCRWSFCWPPCWLCALRASATTRWSAMGTGGYVWYLMHVKRPQDAVDIMSICASLHPGDNMNPYDYQWLSIINMY